MDPNARNVYGWAPLHYAAYRGHRNMIGALLKNGADENVRTKDGKSPNNLADERFLIFRSLGPRGFREPNSYFSSLNADGTWSEPVALDKKLAKIGLFGNLTPDRKYWIGFDGGELFWFDVGAAMEEIFSHRRR